MSLFKPIRAIKVNENHPLARGLAGCWLFNEGCGLQVADVSASGHNIPFAGGTPQWAPGNRGSSVFLNNDDCEYMELDTSPVTDIPCTIVMWLCPDDTTKGNYYYPLYLCNRNVTNQAWGLLLNYENDGEVSLVTNIYMPGRAVSTKCVQAGNWHQIAAVVVGPTDRRCFVDGANKGTNTLLANTPSGLNRISVGRAGDSTPGYYFPGKIGCIFIWNRVLMETDIAWLYREPYVMFDIASKNKSLSFPVDMVPVSGRINAQSSLKGELKTSSKTKQLEKGWLLDIINNAITGNNLTLGTVLSMGWFWMRRKACGALYRGKSIKLIDFTHILKTVASSTETITPPKFCEHANETDYYYVLRRFNELGQEEQTIRAAVKVRIGSCGDIEVNRPSSNFTLSAEIIDGNKIQLNWLYCSLDQKSKPERFKIYFDDGSGKIDYESSIADIKCAGHNYYSFRSWPLGERAYLFAVKAVDSEGNENDSFEQIKIQVGNPIPSSIQIIDSEVCG